MIQNKWFLLIFIFIVTYVVMAMFTFPPALDITRYYETAYIDANSYSSIFQYAKYQYETHVDFVYFTSLYAAAKIGLDLNIVTSFYISLFYYFIIHGTLDKHPSNNLGGFVLLNILFFSPIIWVIEISRTLSAAAFLFGGLFYFNKKRYFVASILLACSIFSHISFLIFVALMFLAYVLKEIKIKKWIIYSLILSSAVLAFISPDYLILLLNSAAENTDSHYSIYASYSSSLPLLDPNIGYGDKLPIVYCLIYSIILVIRSKIINFEFWMLLILTILLSFAGMSSLMLTNRIIMIMPFFVGSIVSTLLSTGNSKDVIIVKILSILGILITVAHIWAYRPSFGF